MEEQHFKHSKSWVVLKNVSRIAVDVYQTWTLLSSPAKCSVPSMINAIYFYIEAILVTCTDNHCNHRSGLLYVTVEDFNCKSLAINFIFLFSSRHFLRAYRNTSVVPQMWKWCLHHSANEITSFTTSLLNNFLLARAHTPIHLLIQSGILIPWLSGMLSHQWCKTCPHCPAHHNPAAGANRKSRGAIQGAGTDVAL